MRLARLATAAGAALALAGAALDADAGGSRGFARPGRSATATVGVHPHPGFHHFHSGVFVRGGGVVVWPSAFYYWPGYYYPPAYYPPAYYPPSYYPPGYAPAYPAEQFWYYCPAVAGYYPYVQQCPTGWQPVRPAAAPPPLG